jgi:hypothetical protein
MTVVWDHVTPDDVSRAIQKYDRLPPEAFFSAHGFGPTTTYDLVWDERLTAESDPGHGLRVRHGPASGVWRFRGRERRRRGGTEKAGIHRRAQAITSQRRLTRTRA